MKVTSLAGCLKGSDLERWRRPKLAENNRELSNNLPTWKHTKRHPSGWWFQIFFIFFTPTWGNDPIWLMFFNWVEALASFKYVSNSYSEYHLKRHKKLILCLPIIWETRLLRHAIGMVSGNVYLCHGCGEHLSLREYYFEVPWKMSWTKIMF